MLKPYWYPVFILCCAAILSSHGCGRAHAQQQQSSSADRVATQIGTLYIQTQQQLDIIADLQKQLTARDARIKELEKSEQKK